jgi:hypothetical protein
MDVPAAPPWVDEVRAPSFEAALQPMYAALERKAKQAIFPHP